jgi:hypothetical protein
MHLTFITRESHTHRIRLELADYSLSDLMGFKEFILLFQCCFAAEGGPWMDASWLRRWFMSLHWQLEVERELIPYRYGVGGDFGGGGESVTIGGERWVLWVGHGECSLSQAVPYVAASGPNQSAQGSRLTKWIDLRGKRELAVDGGVVKLQRRKHAYRWYEELPGLLRFLETLPPEAEVRVEKKAV